MFRWLNKQGVANDETFYLQRIDRFHYEYGEDGTTLKITVEATDRGEDVFLTDAVTAASPAPDRTLIAANVCAALDFMGVPYTLR